jgi:hypothetical protein
MRYPAIAHNNALNGALFRAINGLYTTAVRIAHAVGQGGGFGGGAAPATTCGAWGASSIRVPKKNARCPGLPELCRKSEGLAGMPELRPLFPGGPAGERPLLCHNPQALSNVQEENLSCARDQVVIARPPVLTDTPMTLSALSCE